MNQKLILFGVIILTLVGGSYILGTKKPPSVQTNSLSISPTAVQPNETSSETANWKTYTSMKYGYSIKYPASFQYLNSGGILATDILTDNKNFIEILNPERLTTNVDFTATIKKEGEILISGQKAKEKMGEITSTKGTLIDIGPIKNGKGENYMIRYFSTSQSTEKDLEIFDQILSTFKFTN